jgi:hypothetical protein
MDGAQKQEVYGRAMGERLLMETSFNKADRSTGGPLPLVGFCGDIAYDEYL